MANAAEAVMAAIYLDANAAGKDGFREVRRLVEQKLVKPELATLEAALKSDGGRGALRDAKTLLQVEGMEYLVVGPSTPRLSAETVMQSLTALAPRAKALQLDPEFKIRDVQEASDALLQLFARSD